MATASDGLKMGPANTILEGGSSSSINIKIENPEFLLFTQEVKVCKSAKQALERMVPKIGDMAAVLSHRASKEPSLAKKCEEFLAMRSKFDKFIEELRDFCVHADFVNCDDKIDDIMAKAQDFKVKAGIHETGMKNNLKAFGALVN